VAAARVSARRAPDRESAARLEPVQVTGDDGDAQLREFKVQWCNADERPLPGVEAQPARQAPAIFATRPLVATLNFRRPTCSRSFFIFVPA